MNAYDKAGVYSYNIHWSQDLGGYVATVAEFPTLKSPAAGTPQAAIDALTNEVTRRLHELDEKGEPHPLSTALG